MRVGNRSLGHARLDAKHSAAVATPHDQDAMAPVFVRVVCRVPGPSAQPVPEFLQASRAAGPVGGLTVDGQADLLAELLRSATTIGIERHQIGGLLTDAATVGTQLLQDLKTDAPVYFQQAKQEVFAADVVVSELQRLSEAVL